MTLRPRVLVLGCGWIARQVHLPYLVGLQRDRRVEAVYAADAEEGKATAIAQEFGVRPYRLGALAGPSRPDGGVEPGALEGFDVVVVAAFPGSHARLIQAALAAGAHVIGEKPLRAHRRFLGSG
ncbi:Gfo/Idh/MocA family oxidoreductase [Actinoallomurus sp. NBC_01490]|uniref:Gfo/Idh/MocA family oxidoreductase n=1 Tax=Actinoallomurus sp. NBC_01490 TaxID=2903557 RepID=UPI002E347D5C|nr:Gfo/Idh/MocA family oxidoreductase [Actinoallomurus sp. NBC_01490]